MKTFFWRELERQTPAAVALLAIGELIGLGFYYYGRLESDKIQGLFASLAIVALGAPFLLALNSSAPDAESGALAFLGRLPISRRRELGVRWGAAGLLSLATLAVASIVPFIVAMSGSKRVIAENVEWLTGPVITTLPLLAFALGAVASSAIGRTLHALVFAPFFLLAAAPLGMLLVAATSEHVGKYAVVQIAFGSIEAVLLVAAAVAHLRGDVHRRSWRPVVLAGAVVLVPSLVAGGVAGTAAAATVVHRIATRVPHRVLHSGLPGGRLIIETEYTDAAFPLEGKVRFRVVDPTTGPGPWFDRETTGYAVGFVPDGSALVLHVPGEMPTLGLLDLASGKLRKLQPPPGLEYLENRAELDATAETPGEVPQLRFSSPAPVNEFAQHWIAWRGQEPFYGGTAFDHEPDTLSIPRETAVVDAAGKRTTLPGLADDVSGSRILVRLASGAFAVVDVSREPFLVTPVPLPELFAPFTARLDPGSSRVYFLGTNEAKETRLVAAEPTNAGACQGFSIRIEVHAGETLESVWANPSPSEGRLAIETNWLAQKDGTQALRLEVHDGRSGALERRLDDVLFDPGLVWSPSESRIACQSWWLDLASPTSRPIEIPRLSDLPGVSFLDEDRLLVSGSVPLTVFDLPSGNTVRGVADPWPLRRP